MEKKIVLKKNLTKEEVLEAGFYEKEDGTYLKPVEKGIDSIGLTYIDLEKNDIRFRLFELKGNYRRTAEPYFESEVKSLLKEGILEMEETC